MFQDLETNFSETKKCFEEFCFEKGVSCIQDSNQMKKIREQLGLSQTDMAKLIGSSKTTGSLYEKGIRPLNAKELGRLSAIEILMERTAAIQLYEKISLNDQKALVAMLRKLAYEQKMATLKCETLRAKLTKMEETYASNRKLWQLLQTMKTDVRGTTANPYEGVLEIRCLEKLKSCGLHQQILLRHQMAILECEITSAQQLMEEYEGYGLPVMEG
jgi:DNA-binding XRE family transcriptional regulator